MRCFSPITERTLKMIELVNPKTREILKSDLSEEQAIKLCSEMKRNNFAQSLVSQYCNSQFHSARPLSPAQWYWVFKLAEDSKPITPVELQSDLQEFIGHTTTMQFKVELPDKTYAKVLLRTTPTGILVQACWRTVGKIVGNRFYPSKGCPTQVALELFAMSINPMEWMENYGKRTGVCCVCGRELTNEESVARGIGPICASYFGG